MKHAYLIAAHHQIELLKVQLSLLDDDRNDIYLHIDLRCSEFDEDDIRKSVKKSNIYFIRRRKVSWGGFSQIRLELDLLKSAIDGKYDYYHLISGVDMPIKTQDEIHEFFKKNDGKEFISFDYVLDLDDINYRFGQYRQFQEVYANKKNWLYKLDAVIIRLQRLFGINRISKLGMQVKKGSNWFSITHGLAVYILDHEDFIERSFKMSRCCDEVFLQTLVYNSEFKENLYYNANAGRCYNMRLVDFKRGNPYVFRKCDYELLVNAEELFARKFDWLIDKDVILMIKEYITNRSVNNG